MARNGIPRPGAIVPAGAGSRTLIPLLAVLALAALAVELPQRSVTAVQRAAAATPVELSVRGVRILPEATIVLAPDVSGSMFNSDLYRAMVDWARPQLRYLSTEPAFRPPNGNDTLFLVPWSDAPVVRAGPTDWAGIERTLGDRSPVDGGGTSVVPLLDEVDRLVPAGRPGVALVFTDGNVGDQTDLTADAVRRLADRGIAVHVVGMGTFPNGWSDLRRAWGGAPLAGVTPNGATSLGRLLAEAVGLEWTGS